MSDGEQHEEAESTFAELIWTDDHHPTEESIRAFWMKTLSTFDLGEVLDHIRGSPNNRAEPYLHAGPYRDTPSPSLHRPECKRCHEILNRIAGRRVRLWL